MGKNRRILLFTLVFLVVGFSVCLSTLASFGPANLKKVKKEVIPKLKASLGEKDLSLGAPIFIRIFKQSSELEVWVKKKDKFHLFRTFPICTFSGELGPKLKEGDDQSPEGFYFVRQRQMHPGSRYHLAFNIGFPNSYDRAHMRTGSYLMVHGNCVSIGCYAMTNAGIEKIYLLADAALTKGQSFFRVHIFPFRMTEKNMNNHKKSKWHSFWQNLKEGYDYFEKHKIPPNVKTNNLRYVFSSD